MAVDPSRLGVYVLDVGQGDCTFLVPPQGEGDPILFDCADAQTAERFVANHGIKHLAAVIASHLDKDHIGGMLAFLQDHLEKRGTIGTLYLTADRAAPRRITNALAALLDQAMNWEENPPCAGFTLKAPVRTNDGPIRVAGGQGWRIEIVLPFQGTLNRAVSAAGGQPNLASAVVRVERAGTSVLIGGDAPLGSWGRLESAHARATAIRTPHHGGDILEAGRAWRTFEDLYDAVQAEHALVSVGTGNRHGHPLPDHLSAARRGGACEVRCTQLTDRCHPRPLDRQALALAQAGGVEYPYRHRAPGGTPTDPNRHEVPCVGSMALWLDGQGRVELTPDPLDPRSPHAQLVSTMATPMCR